MIGDFLLRLLLALPIILLLAVASLFLWRRTGFPAPGLRPVLSRLGAHPAPDPARLHLISHQLVAPGVRVAVLRYGGMDYLVGAAATGVTLLATLAAGHAPEPSE